MLSDGVSSPLFGGEFGSWSQVGIGIAIESEASFIDQPRGQQLEYRVKAVNIGSESVTYYDN